MNLQQWCLSWRGRLGRRDFWIGLTVWMVLMLLLFNLAANGRIARQTAALLVLLLMWPGASLVIKRLHDRNKGGHWALLLVLAWCLLDANLAGLSLYWQWFIGRFIPALIVVTLLVELGGMGGSLRPNRFGKPALPVHYFGRRRTANYQ